jgi:hypothetical protein
MKNNFVILLYLTYRKNTHMAYSQFFLVVYGVALHYACQLFKNIVLQELCIYPKAKSASVCRSIISITCPVIVSCQCPQIVLFHLQYQFFICEVYQKASATKTIACLPYLRVKDYSGLL